MQKDINIVKINRHRLNIKKNMRFNIFNIKRAV